MWRYRRELLLGLLFTGVLVGQFFRVDLFHSAAGGLLIADYLTLAVSLGVLMGLGSGRIAWPAEPAVNLLLVFVGALALSFAFNFSYYAGTAQLIAFGYLVRIAGYLSLIIVGYRLYGSSPQLISRYFAYLVAGLLVLGLVILYVLPDFSVLVQYGWDPHQGRLTSTWLDPNFFGCFLAMAFTYFLALAPVFRRQATWRYALYIIGLLVVWTGLYLTFSRSALLTVLVGALVVAVMTSWRTTVLFLALFALTVSAPSRLQSRFQQSVAFTLGGGSKISSTAQPTDPTASARINSWKRAISIGRTSPIVGVGYNFYQDAQVRLGFARVQDLATNRSAAGSDSSILNFFATAGILGLVSYLVFLVFLIKGLWRGRFNRYSLGALGLTVAWLVSSLFNNTLLYALTLLPLMLVIGNGLYQSHLQRGAE